MSKKTENVVEFICCNATRGTLEQTAKTFGYKNVHKMSRIKLENIYYSQQVLSIDSKGHFGVIVKDSDFILIKRCCAKFLIDWIIRECYFEWYDEREYPIYKRLNKEINILHCIK